MASSTSTSPPPSATSRSRGWAGSARSSRSSPPSTPTMAEVEPSASASSDARQAIEAVLMVAETPVEPQLLAQLLEMPVARISELCSELSAEYEATGRGFVLARRSEEHTSELQSLMRISYAVFCLKK